MDLLERWFLLWQNNPPPSQNKALEYLTHEVCRECCKIQSFIEIKESSNINLNSQLFTKVKGFFLCLFLIFLLFFFYWRVISIFLPLPPAAVEVKVGDDLQNRKSASLRDDHPPPPPLGKGFSSASLPQSFSTWILAISVKIMPNKSMLFCLCPFYFRMVNSLLDYERRSLLDQ